METIAKSIEREVTSWPDVQVQAHRFGGVEFHVHQHEIGHLHSDQLADLPFPVRLRKELVAAGRAQLHHMLPDTGWVSYYIRSADDVPGAITLFRLNYERLLALRRAPEADDPASDEALDAYDQIVEDSFPASDPPGGQTSLV